MSVSVDGVPAPSALPGAFESNGFGGVTGAAGRVSAVDPDFALGGFAGFEGPATER